MVKKSKKRGKNISELAEVANISKHGFWLIIGDKEFFLEFKHYPWFRQATIDQICELQFFHGKHLHWPTLDIDIDLDSLQHPESYPLVYK